ncbi:MAG: prolyl oligopeptidase family serine peptidase [Planctomycetota bacterium]|nr:prolyl oligopeptidase family serine peptidase [Planctomycetota bacterium]
MAAEDTRPVHPIPKLKECAVDGQGSDWGDDGLRVLAFSEDGVEAADPRVLKASARVAWAERGLAVLVDVDSSAEWNESNAARTAYEADSVELFLRVGGEGKPMVQPIVSPGMAANQPELRTYVWDYRGKLADWKDVPMSVEAARVKREGGFTLEALIPWSNLKYEAAAGAEVEFRVNVNKRLPGLGRRQFVWREAGGQEFHRLQLADRAGAPVRQAGWIVSDPARGLCANVIAPEESAGQKFRVLRGGKEIASAELRAGPGRSQGWLALPFDLADGTPLTLALGETNLGSDAPVHPRQSLQDQIYLSGRYGGRRGGGQAEVAPQVDAVFSGTALPAVRPGDARLMALAGVLGFETKWFDEGLNEATSAEKPGRYAAVITVKLDGAEPILLYRNAWRIDADADKIGAAVAEALKAPTEGGRALKALGESALSALADRADLPKTFAAAAANESARADAFERLWWHKLRTKLGTQTKYEYFRTLPKGYDDDKEKRWPAILYLHGSGGRLPRDYQPMEKRNANRDLAGWAMGKGTVPFVIYSLQSFGGWEPPAVIDTLEKILKEDRIDPDRVIVMGFSMGGMGTWACACDYPDRWAAAVPLGGRGDRAGEVDRVKTLPVWVFNGDRDTTTTLADAEKIVNALKAIQGNVKLTVLKDAGHGETQNGAFETEGLWEWLGAQKRK